MSDILTQIQDEIDFLLNMMHRQLAFIRNNAPPSVPPGQTRVDTFAEVQAKTTTESTQTTQPSQPSQPTITSQPTQPNQPAPVSPEQFNEDIKEFARDIVLKQQQIEALIANLPGLNVSEAQQVERMKVLERELEELEGERVKAGHEREVLLKRVEERIGGVGRGR